MKSLLFILFLLPGFVFASSSSDFSDLSFFLFMEAFVSIHMSVFVLIPSLQRWAMIRS